MLLVHGNLREVRDTFGSCAAMLKAAMTANEISSNEIQRAGLLSP